MHSSVLARTRASHNVGSAMVTKTVLMERTRVSGPAVVRATAHSQNVWSMPEHEQDSLLCKAQNMFISLFQSSTTRAAPTSSCARTVSAFLSTSCVTMTTTAATAQTSLQSVVSGVVKSSDPLWFSLNESKSCFSFQSILRAGPLSSAVTTAAASVRRHGSVTASLTVMTIRMKHQRTRAAPAQVKHADLLHGFVQTLI